MSINHEIAKITAATIRDGAIDPASGNIIKSVAQLSDPEFQAAVQRRAWRQPRPAIGDGATPHHAREFVTDAEFTAALARKSWRH